jgi:hypothetical protein
MSNRTVVELNHDYCPGDEELEHWAKQMQIYMASGDRRELPRGVAFKYMRHHSEPDPASDAATIISQARQIAQLKTVLEDEQVKNRAPRRTTS